MAVTWRLRSFVVPCPESPLQRSPRRCVIPRRHSTRLCTAAGTVAPPLLDGRKSVPSRAHANMHASIGVTGYPRSGKLPAPSRHRSPARSQTVRGSRLTPAAASRWSKVGPIARPRQHACKHRCDRIPKVRQTARAVAPSLCGTLADCARQPAHSRRRFSMVVGDKLIRCWHAWAERQRVRARTCSANPILHA